MAPAGQVLGVSGKLQERLSWLWHCGQRGGGAQTGGTAGWEIRSEMLAYQEKQYTGKTGT